MDFVVEGAMIGGFALAAPAEYRVTGVKTFIVSYKGNVYEKDLGPDTLNIFKGNSTTLTRHGTVQTTIELHFPTVYLGENVPVIAQT
jgi:hypothetical protein